MVTFEASFYAETDNSIAVLCIKGDPEGNSWNTKEWFPKSSCVLGERSSYGKMNVTVPLWLLKIKKLEDKVTLAKKEQDEN